MSTDETADAVEQDIIKTSKLERLGTAAVTAGIFVIPSALGAAATFFSFKISKMNYETAKLNLEAAKAALEK
jgi:hypothetical protein